jgi:hypothetical protein
LNTSDKEHPETHEKSTDEKHGPATPFVNVDDGGNLERKMIGEWRRHGEEGEIF